MPIWGQDINLPWPKAEGHSDAALYSERTEIEAWHLCLYLCQGRVSPQTSELWLWQHLWSLTSHLKISRTEQEETLPPVLSSLSLLSMLPSQGFWLVEHLSCASLPGLLSALPAGVYGLLAAWSSEACFCWLDPLAQASLCRPWTASVRPDPPTRPQILRLPVKSFQTLQSRALYLTFCSCTDKQYMKREKYADHTLINMEYCTWHLSKKILLPEPWEQQ